MHSFIENDYSSESNINNMLSNVPFIIGINKYLKSKIVVENAFKKIPDFSGLENNDH
jgi:hypothetical protein